MQINFHHRISRTLTWIALRILLLQTLPAFAGSGTGVGNGGDPLFSYLETSRCQLVETLRILLRQKPEEQQNFCTAPALSSEQQSFCRNFVIETLEQVITLNLSPKKVLFVLREAPLLVTGPDGNAMPVVARTSMGPDGVIEFHKPELLAYSPARLLFILAHEFGHKTIFRGSTVTDNETIGPFAIGRELLDAAAMAVVDLARQKGMVPSGFSLRDIFQCEATIAGFPQSVMWRASSPRNFYDSKLEVFETGVSRNSQDPWIGFQDSPTSKVVLRIRSSEKAGCHSPENIALRSTTVEIVRVHDTKPDHTELPDDLLAQSVMPGYNPVCEENARWLELATGNVRFRCQYLGPEAVNSYGRVQAR